MSPMSQKTAQGVCIKREPPRMSGHRFLSRHPLGFPHSASLNGSASKIVDNSFRSSKWYQLWGCECRKTRCRRSPDNLYLGYVPIRDFKFSAKLEAASRSQLRLGDVRDMQIGGKMVNDKMSGLQGIDRQTWTLTAWEDNPRAGTERRIKITTSYRLQSQHPIISYGRGGVLVIVYNNFSHHRLARDRVTARYTSVTSRLLACPKGVPPEESETPTPFVGYRLFPSRDRIYQEGTTGFG